MTRPSKNTDKKLLQAGKELIPVVSFSGLSIREVAKKANVNPGMFNYYFGTKERYIETLISEVYDEFFTKFKLESETGGDSFERLRNTLLAGAFFIRDNRMLIEPFLAEIVMGNKKLMEFARKNMTRHIGLILGLLSECRKDGYVTKASIFSVLPVLIGAVALPNIAVRILEKNYRDTFYGLAVAGLKNTILSDKIIIERLDLALKGISTEKINEK